MRMLTGVFVALLVAGCPGKEEPADAVGPTDTGAPDVSDTGTGEPLPPEIGPPDRVVEASSSKRAAGLAEVIREVIMQNSAVIATARVTTWYDHGAGKTETPRFDQAACL